MCVCVCVCVCMRCVCEDNDSNNDDGGDVYAFGHVKGTTNHMIVDTIFMVVRYFERFRTFSQLK